MIWTEKERELIAILDNFIESCSQSERLKNVNYYRLVKQIVAVTNGELNSTRKYCQQVLYSQKQFTQNEKINLEDVIDRDFLSSEKKQSNSLTQKVYSPAPKIKSSWTVLFLLFAIFAIFFMAKKSPDIRSSNNFTNIAIFCPVELMQTAQTGIKNHNETLLKKAIADLTELKKQQSDRLGLECEQILWETQFIYAIDFLASQGQNKQAVQNLCKISVRYFQNKEVIPWFTRWSNTNRHFSQWLTQYKANNNCPVASYLE